MPLQADDSSDFEKLNKALSKIVGKFASFDDFLQAFGLSSMPTAQRYGIIFGFIVFCSTVFAVLTLLVLGGSFKRIKEQESTGDANVSDVVSIRANRPLLYERLLDARERMMKNNYKPKPTSEGQSNLMKMILNMPIEIPAVAELTDEDENVRNRSRSSAPPEYVDAYVEAYRKCQEKPGGPVVSGEPEARFEAYARAWAGCNQFVARNYRRSYARLYEHLACQTHANVKKYEDLYRSRPQDLVGRLVRLEALEADRHLRSFYEITSGFVYMGHKSYEPKEVWGFLPYGPFENADELRDCPIFQRREDEGAFAIIDNITDKMIGVIMLTRDDPSNLTIEMEPPIFHPSYETKPEPVEACFLLADRLIALGYRRIQLTTDAQDQVKKRLAVRAGFTKEAEIPKHKIVKEASRDSIIYGLLNSDWKKGARYFLYHKIHGPKLAKIDAANEKKEAELDDQMEKLAQVNGTKA